VAEGAGGARELIRTTAAARETLLPLNAAQLPPGRSTLRMEFLIGGEVRLSEERVVNVGLLELHIEDLYVDEARGQIAAKVRAGADGALADVPLTVAAVFSSRLFEGGSLREEE